MNGLTLRESDHTYWLNRRRIPGVTEILSGLTDDYYKFVDPKVLELKAQLGRAAHRACELWDNEDLDESTVDDLVRPYLNAWIKFLKETKFKVIYNEQLVFHDVFQYAGTLDRMGLMYGKHPALIDIKCIESKAPHMGIQTAAYHAAANLKASYKDARRYTVHLKPDGKFEMHEYTERMDFAVFQSLLNLRNWRLRHGYCSE